jgi:hypothetical protein
LNPLAKFPFCCNVAHRCRACGGEAFAYDRFAHFPAREYEAIVEAAKRLPGRAVITPPKNKDGRVKVDFFPDVRGTSPGLWVCSQCGKRMGATASNDPELFYQTRVRGVRLWAHDREHLVQLREYIEKRANRGQGFHKLPKTILKAANRELVLKKIDELLAGD